MSNSVNMMTFAAPWRKARGANATDNGFPTRTNVLSSPWQSFPAYTKSTAAQATNYALQRASGMSAYSGAGAFSQNIVWLMPYAVGNDNVTFSMRVYGVNRILVAETPDIIQFRWTMLAQFACTASADVGVAGGLVLSTERFADTIALTYPTAAISSIEIQTNAADVAGWVKVDLSGSEDYEITFTTGGSATSCNALVKEY